jgi:sugar fermentation stimulation protein A
LGREIVAAENPLEAIFITRLNRFTVLVRVEGRRVRAYLPNSGRLKEFLAPGRLLILEKAKKNGKRKTRYTVVGALAETGVKVSVDARMPNRLMAEALRQNELEEFKGFRLLRAEPELGAGRMDFLLEGAKGEKFLVEVKSCTLAENGVAMFPDAPTERGRRHLEGLTRMVEKGWKTAIVFLAQREDVEKFQPNHKEDPRFAEALKTAAGKGVKTYAYKATFDGKILRILERIPVKITRG